MSERLVVSFRWQEKDSSAEAFFAAVAVVQSELQSLPSQWVGWGADGYSLVLAGNVQTALAAVLRALGRAPSLSAGVALRALSQDAAGRSWGPALVIAEGLAAVARRAECLLDPALVEVLTPLPSGTGSLPVDLGRQALNAALLRAQDLPALGWEPLRSDAFVDLDSSVVDSAVPTPRAADFESGTARTESAPSTAEDRPTLADSPQASSRPPAPAVPADFETADTGSGSSQPRRRRASWPAEEPIPEIPASVGEPLTLGRPPVKPHQNSDASLVYTSLAEMDAAASEIPALLVHSDPSATDAALGVPERLPLGGSGSDESGEMPGAADLLRAPEGSAHSAEVLAVSVPRNASGPPPKPSVRPKPSGLHLSEPPPKPPRNASDPHSAGRTSGVLVHTGFESIADTLQGVSEQSPQPSPESESDRDSLTRIEASVVTADLDLGLLRLRDALRLAQQMDSPNVGRARLAVAVGLQRSGNPREAYLEALLALAWAREVQDSRAERACARLLARLTRGAGFAEPAVVWDTLCA
jgi:hypothetical protein